FATKKTAWNPGPNVCNFTVTLGLQVVVSENGVRKTYSARYYNPATGRFLSRDPDDHSPRNPNELHKYLYANGNPISMIDPTGHGALEGYDAVNVALVLRPITAFLTTELALRSTCTIAVIALLDKMSPDIQWRVGGILLAACGII
ncbi:MAG: RHS repeat-associated core domain-containing protein, partial [Terracidiphilus sp.]